MFHQIEKNPKICMKPQKTPNSPSSPEQKKQSWSHNTCFKTYHKVTPNKTAWHQHERAHTHTHTHTHTQAFLKSNTSTNQGMMDMEAKLQHL
jgi:hypothetical protein